ncbi:MAG: hypothetical protein GY757_57380 [bacterium]|nr:hypothetical protein [bacterium]
MKKTLVLIIFAVAMTLLAGTLQAENVNWNVSSDNTCRTYFHVGEHANPVIIMQIRVNPDLSPRNSSYTWQEVHTLNANQHYVDSTECPNWRFLYKLVDATTGDLISTQVFQINANESASGSCSYCYEIDSEKK